MNQSAPYIDAKVHVGVQEDREPRKRPKMFFFDRIKVLLIIAVLLTLTTMYKGQQVPLMSIGDAIRDQAHAKRWLLIVAGHSCPRSQSHQTLRPE